MTNFYISLFHVFPGIWEFAASCKCYHRISRFSLATPPSNGCSASQVTGFMSPDINPVVCVNVTGRLASESAQSLFRNPSLAYYGAIVWVPCFFGISDVRLVLMHCKPHDTNLHAGTTTNPAENYRMETWNIAWALLWCDGASIFPNVARCLNRTLSHVDKALSVGLKTFTTTWII